MNATASIILVDRPELTCTAFFCVAPGGGLCVYWGWP
jgi:hypothetical protein